MKSLPSDIRPWHYISRNVRTATPTSCLFVDTETTGIPIEGNPNATLQVLRSWCAIYCRLEKGQIRKTARMNGTTTEHFWEYVRQYLSDRRPLWLFAHNLGFDLTVLKFWDQLDSNKYTFSDIEKSHTHSELGKGKYIWKGFAVLDDPPVIIECRQKHTKDVLICNDTYNYFRCSVADLGESIGLPKLPMPVPSASQAEWDTYCFRDVEIIQTAITGLMEFVQQHDLGMWKYTAPAQAMSAYRHRFMREKILVHGNKDAIKLERDAYYGGRLECRYVGPVFEKESEEAKFWIRPDGFPGRGRIGPIYVLDIQSCYPAMMLWKSYPRAIFDYFVSPSLEELREAVDVYCVIARVTIESYTEPFPYHHDGRTDMCVGRFVTSLCGPELKYAMEIGVIVNVGSMAVYYPEDLFSEYVSTFWNMRQGFMRVNDMVHAQWCKLMLNSLAGKFGQRARRWEATDKVEAPEPWCQWAAKDLITGKSAVYRSMALHVQQEQQVGESIDSCPSIAAYVTSYAREYLRQLIHIAGSENVCYVDTDCLHTNYDGFKRLADDNRCGLNSIGMLRCVGEYQSAEYRGLKDYTLDAKDTIAGVKYNAEVLGNRQYRQDQFQKLHSILSHKPAAGVRVDRVTIDRRGTHVRGRVQPDGTVLPMLIQ